MSTRKFGRQLLVLVPLAILAVFSAAILSAEEPKEDSLTARQILNRMAITYADCTSYHDTGTAKTVLIEKSGRRTRTTLFSTAFVRPERFRFECNIRRWWMKEDRFIVWRNRENFRTWWALKPDMKKPKSFALAMARGTGISDGSAHTIPTLLMPKELRGRRLTSMQEVKRIKDAKFDGVECFCIKGKYANSPRVLWIDKKTFLVRRIDDRREHEDFRTERTTTYNPTLNERIPEEKLHFKQREEAEEELKAI